MCAKLFLIRHGETDWNYQRRYCSFTDLDLNEKGKNQARQVHKILNKEVIHKVYTSDRKRTCEFAGIVFKGLPIEKLPDLREIKFGIFEGLTYQEIMKAYPKIYRGWLDDPLNLAIPEGESLNNLAERVRKTLARILSHNRNRTVAIVTHAGPIRVILCDTLNLDLKEIWQIEPDLASISIIEFVKGRGRICLLNDTSYLNG